MQDGSGSINIDVKVNLDNIKKLANGFSDLQTITKNADYQFRQQKITFDELGVTLNAVNTRAKELNGSYKQYVDLNASVFQVTQRAENNFKSLSGSLNDIHNSIRQRTAPSMMAFSGIVQDSTQFTAGFGQGMRAVGNNIEFMTQTMMQAANSGMTFKQIMQGMILNLAGPSGILLLVSAVTMLATVFGDKLFPSAKKVTDELEKQARLTKDMQESEYEAGLISAAERRAQLASELSDARIALENRKKDMPVEYRETGLMFGATAAGGSGEANIGTANPSAPINIDQLRKNYADALKAFNEFEESLLKGKRGKKEHQQSTDWFDDFVSEVNQDVIDRYNHAYNEERRANKAAAHFLEEQAKEFDKGTTLNRLHASDIVPEDDARKKRREMLENRRVYSELIDENAILVDSMLSGFGAVGNAIQNDIHDGLVNAFDGANTYAQKFIVGLLDGITAISTKLASTAAVSGILSLVTGKSFGGIFDAMSGGLSKALGYADGGIIPEPVFGIGASGRAYTFAERGPEYVSSNASLRSAMNDRYSSGDGGVARAIRNIQWSATVSSEGLRVATVRANAKRQLNQVR